MDPTCKCTAFNDLAVPSTPNWFLGSSFLKREGVKGIGFSSGEGFMSMIHAGVLNDGLRLELQGPQKKTRI